MIYHRNSFLWVPAILLVFLGLGLAQICPASEMRAGVAKVDITPPLGMPLLGYYDRTDGAKGELDPLYARILVLESGNTRLAYVDLDLGRTFGPSSLESLRKAVQSRTVASTT